MGKHTLVAGLLVVGGFAWAAPDSTDWTTTRLNDSAVRDGSGALVVLGTEGSYNDLADRTRAAVFDGDAATFFDPPGEANPVGGCWAGIELAEAQCVTRIRYFGRPDFQARILGCLFQGANTPDFSDAVTLHVATAADGWDGTHWADVFVAHEAALQPFKYLRILAPNSTNDSTEGVCAGNAAEVEFYGVPRSRFDTFTKEPTFPESYLTGKFFINHRFTIGVAWTSRVPFYEVQRKPAAADDTAWRDCGTIPFVYDGYTATTNPGYLFTDPEPVDEPTDYRVRAYSPTQGGSAWYDIGTQIPGSIAQGTWIGPRGSWGDVNSTLHDGSRAFDGDINTFADLPTETNVGGWTGLDLGRPLQIVGAKAAPRPGDFYNRLDGSVVQVADAIIPDPTGKTEWEFENPVTVGTFTGATRNGVLTLVFDEPVTARYVRVKAGDGLVFNLSEFEVDLAPLQNVPELHVGMSDIENEFAALSWEHYDLVREPRDAIVISRSTNREGPWTELAVLAPEAVAYVDETLAVGPRYYYALTYRQTVDGVVREGARSLATYRRGRRLDRTADGRTLLPGVSIVCDGTPWGDGAGSKEKPFDGDEATYADMNEDTAYLGLDFTTPVGVTAVRALPRPTNANRLNGAGVYGLNDLAAWRAQPGAPATPVTAPFAFTGTDWTVTLGETSEMFRYIVLGKEDGDWNCNVNEIQIYGWTADDLAQVLLPPDGVDFTPETDGLVLAWPACAKAVSYQVLRRRDTAAWQTLATGLAEPTWKDASVPYDGTSYQYQIVVVGADDETVSSEPFPVTPYLPGHGTGLYGVYYKNFTHAFDPAEAVALERVDPVINFDWGTEAPDPAVGGDYFRVVWTGKLLVPFAGDYVFTTTQDDGVRLQIDGQDVINDILNWSTLWSGRGAITLGAGEHDIRLDFIEQVGNARCSLSWGGCLPTEIIPASQLVPEKVDAAPVPKPWLGTRQFGGSLLGDVRFEEDGSLLASEGGQDIWADQEAFTYAWQKAKRAFQATVKIDLTNVPQLTPHARGMLMVRSGLPQGEPFFLAMLEGGARDPRFCCKARAGRLEDGVDIADVMGWQADGAAHVVWLRIRRQRDTFEVSYKTEEKGPWQDLFTYDAPAGMFGDEVFIGPAAGSGSEHALCYARFSEFVVEQLHAPSVIFIR